MAAVEKEVKIHYVGVLCPTCGGEDMELVTFKDNTGYCMICRNRGCRDAGYAFTPSQVKFIERMHGGLKAIGCFEER